ncbi:hypothetical protein ACFFSY_19845 [Paenibacillus aurantiacus]|uniref:Uncharacterized protein n=1 Tax=Paenibacillus aurantiacus TaxID=1936118 RepID=A0ABV5KVE4_9BACL
MSIRRTTQAGRLKQDDVTLTCEQAGRAVKAMANAGLVTAVLVILDEKREGARTKITIERLAIRSPVVVVLPISPGAKGKRITIRCSGRKDDRSHGIAIRILKPLSL